MTRTTQPVHRTVYRITTALTLAAATLLAAPAGAQDDRMRPIAVPAQPAAIVLGTGALEGATTAESWHSQYGSVFARNVTVATLTPFLPSPGKATGAAVVVAPGGGFRTLSMQNEGWDVAQALAAKGSMSRAGMVSGCTPRAPPAPGGSTVLRAGWPCTVT